MTKLKLEQIRDKRAEAWAALWRLEGQLQPEMKEDLDAIEKSLEFSGDLCEEVERLQALVLKLSQQSSEREGG